MFPTSLEVDEGKMRPLGDGVVPAPIKGVT
jgi:hypothetical protein